MAQVVFREADEDEAALLASVREAFHEGIDGFDIGLLFRDKPRLKEGRVVCASAHLARNAIRFLTRLDGWVEVFDDAWSGETIEWRRYLLDHELTHFSVEEGILTIRGHDLADFTEVLERHAPEVTGLRVVFEGVRT